MGPSNHSPHHHHHCLALAKLSDALCFQKVETVSTAGQDLRGFNHQLPICSFRITSVFILVASLWVFVFVKLLREY